MGITRNLDGNDVAVTEKTSNLKKAFSPRDLINSQAKLGLPNSSMNLNYTD